ncbi:hypothetical protein J2S78_002553 [Salibacterium salarium]|uniref:glycosylhydrolase-like jelly roll fold domain-containing protein n=1 Tax=Salibacterium salarium TaxID=284579 RepID=UPI002781E616|nr:glycosylhydrolase-like jelly roll fold domain-containing protein [Salibacterium salarium]MDQ0300106.1 hypothetical protein [Salibacterium salarium]
MVRSLKDQFISPADEFTPIPFWFWNDNLSNRELKRQIHDFYDKEVKGFVLHPRIGLPKEIEYLSDTFMNYVRTAVAEASKLGMKVILYDEAMYPSGSAHGQVVKRNPKYRSRGLKMMEWPCGKYKELKINLPSTEKIVSAQAVKKLSPSSIDPTATILLENEGEIVTFSPPDEKNWSMLLFVETYSEGTIRGIHFGEDDGEEHAPPSADLLNAEAVDAFIQSTHDRYYEVLDKYFGNTILAMFTDEPDILGRNSLPGLIPWTTEFLPFYLNQGNNETDLPVLWFEGGEKTDVVRSDYRKTVHAKLTSAYYEPISEWCETHDISLTGHPAASNDIGLLAPFHIPGQDVVWRWVAPEDGKGLEGEHSTAGKCSADAARHRGRRRNLNEFLGVCGKESEWALSPGDMKWYIDWLAIRGVNLFCPHAFYYSIEGRKRSHERPPDVGPNNTWWPYFKYFAQYMKRLSWLQTDSVNDTNVAVLCTEDYLPWKVTKSLYENQIEFNYLEESLLPFCRLDHRLSIEQQQYTTIVLGDNIDVQNDTVKMLENFTANGGMVLVDGSLNHVAGAQTMSHEKEFLRKLQSNYVLQPSTKDLRISKLKKCDRTYYFISNEGDEYYQGELRKETKGKVEKWDPWTGEVVDQPQSDSTIIPLTLNRRETIIYCINSSQNPVMRTSSRSFLRTQILPFQQQWKINDIPIKLENNNQFKSWTGWGDLDRYSGTMVYHNTFEMKENKKYESVFLDLGEVCQIAKVYINGKEAGIKFWAPYVFSLDPNYIFIGENRLIVEVTNNMANRMDDAKLKSGLIGPVQIKVKEHENKNKTGATKTNKLC